MNVATITTVIVSFTFTFTIVTASTAAQVAPEKLCAVVTDRLNLRAGPGISYPIVGELPPGSILVILNDANVDWQKVASRLGEGWLSTNFIQPTLCEVP